MKELIIDGYNVIYSWPALKRIGSLEVARERLADVLGRYADASEVRVTIVYDGRGGKETVQEGNPRVVFTRTGETADCYIERLVSESEEKSQICIASDDFLHQQLVFGMGSFFMSAEGLKQEVDKEIGEMRRKISNLIREQKG